MLKLQVMRGKHKGRALELTGDGRYSVGRRECDIDLTDDTVSSRHARLSSDGHRWFLEDLCSTNGTFINENRIRSKESLSPGDQIRLGQAVIKVNKAPSNGRAHSRAKRVAENDSSPSAQECEQQRLMLKILVIRGIGQGKTFELEFNHPMPIGRRSKVLPVDDDQVSRRHAVLIPKGGQWFLRDLASRNGTFINCKPINGTMGLKEGDLIEIGRTQLQVTSAPEPEDILFPIEGASPQDTALEQDYEDLYIPDVMSPADTAFTLDNEIGDDLTKTAKELERKAQTPAVNVIKPEPLSKEAQVAVDAQLLANATSIDDAASANAIHAAKPDESPVPHLENEAQSDLETESNLSTFDDDLKLKESPLLLKENESADSLVNSEQSDLALIDSDESPESTEAFEVIEPFETVSPEPVEPAIRPAASAPESDSDVFVELPPPLAQPVESLVRAANDLPVTMLPASENVSDYLADRQDMLHLFIDRTLGKLSRHEIAVWLVLYRDSNTNNLASTGHTIIAQRVGVSQSTINRAIRKLEDTGLLSVIYRGGLQRGTSCYRVFGKKQVTGI